MPGAVGLKKYITVVAIMLQQKLQLSLYDMPTEILIKIFYYMEISDICKLKQTCKRLHEILTAWDHVMIRDVNVIVTNQIDKRVLARTHLRVTALDKIRISKNWREGHYEDRSLLYERMKYIPWLSLNSESLWISRGNKIVNYKRDKKSINTHRPIYTLSGKSDADVVRFTLKNSFLVSGQRDGSIWLWSLTDRRLLLDVENCHISDINSVDISNCGQIIVSGSRENNFKIWKRHDDQLKESCTKSMGDRVWCVSISDDQSLVAIGTAGIQNNKSIFCYDIENFVGVSNFDCNGQRGAAAFDIKWDGPFTFWSCGYDSYLRKWDLRCGKCVQYFQDYHGSVSYCMDLDYYNTVMTGCQLHGKVILWDTRQRGMMQIYYMNSCKNRKRGRSSPVYSLSFDPINLFAATDQHLNILDFSTFNGIEKDYSMCLRY